MRWFLFYFSGLSLHIGWHSFTYSSPFWQCVFMALHQWASPSMKPSILWVLLHSQKVQHVWCSIPVSDHLVFVNTFVSPPTKVLRNKGVYENVKFVQQENFWIGPSSVSHYFRKSMCRSLIYNLTNIWSEVLSKNTGYNRTVYPSSHSTFNFNIVMMISVLKPKYLESNRKNIMYHKLESWLLIFQVCDT